MKQIRQHVDERLAAFCAYCGLAPSTRDHIPSRVLLDEPFPAELPVIQACLTCNRDLSADEEYLACLVDCVLAGTCDADEVSRAKIRRLLREKPALAERLRQALQVHQGTTLFSVENERVQRVIVKLARGHAAYENGELCLDEPSHIWLGPLHLLSRDQKANFEQIPTSSVWPEVGSRAMIRMVEGGSADGWIEVQPGRYRYGVGITGNITVRIVLSGYLGAEVMWE